MARYGHLLLVLTHGSHVDSSLRIVVCAGAGATNAWWSVALQPAMLGAVVG